MDKVLNWNGMTQSHGFQIEVFRDTNIKDFVAKIQTSSPALMPPKVPGKPIPVMKFDAPEEIRHEDLNRLRELTKKSITDRCGEILQFFEHENFSL